MSKNQLEKWEEDLGRQFLEKERKVVHKYMQTYSASLSVREAQIEMPGHRASPIGRHCWW